ncbi:glycosyltransferase family protein [Gloeocapsa sp. PCC 73106]|uniref:glycosyltransferase family protein n=1 Tax=Gloeocapsa sp. PCC 73106 TaxID=102232 RepID=UPI0002ACD245|nr:glycosyltransferase [Gloeocapsa sp. PCC 73106]ELR99076.1 putative glycosyl transferase [Gloeocapsa sp. PCC 73106]
MPKVLFYCQHILGIGHLIRSIEIIKGLIPEFQVCLINGGQVIEDFPFPQEIEVVNIPAIKTDSEFEELKPVDEDLTLEELEIIRKELILNVCSSFQPDILIIELFPFGRRRFSFEIIPLIEKAKSLGSKIVSSVRDIVVTKQDQSRHEQKVCQLINRYFDLLLIHGDPNFIPLDISFSALDQLTCPVYYTGYVVQPIPSVAPRRLLEQPLILVSVGGGRFGHELLESILKTAPLLAPQIPHRFQVFTGPFCPDSMYEKLVGLALDQDNIAVNRYTPNLIHYMLQADLSISMSGYNTTMNILTTGVKAMMMAFDGNGDLEQITRITKLADLGRIKIISSDDLDPQKMAGKILNYLQETPKKLDLNLNGTENTARYIDKLFRSK